MQDDLQSDLSGDSHIVEPPHLWEKWLPPGLRKFAPKLVKDHDGGDAWQYGESAAPAPIGLVAVKRGRKYTDPDYKWTGMRIDQVNQGAFYGEPRIKEQDEDGCAPAMRRGYTGSATARCSETPGSSRPHQHQEEATNE